MATTVADVARDVVGADRRARAGAAARGPDGRPADAAAVGRRPACRENRAAERYVERLEELGARVVEAEIPEPPDDTWPLFFHEAAESHRATFPARADEYGDNVRAKLEQAQTVEPAEVERARERCGAGATLPARRRPLRRAGARRRAPAGRLRRARGPHPADGVPAAVQRARLGGARDRRPAARRAARRGGARRRRSPGSAPICESRRDVLDLARGRQRITSIGRMPNVPERVTSCRVESRVDGRLPSRSS